MEILFLNYMLILNLFNLKFTNLDNGDNIAEITNSIQLKQNFQFYPRQLLIIAKADNEEKKCIGKVINYYKIKFLISFRN